MTTKLFHYFNADPDQYFCGKTRKVVTDVDVLDYITTDIDSVNCDGCLSAYIGNEGVE